jgi:hypothetical protein
MPSIEEPCPIPAGMAIVTAPSIQEPLPAAGADPPINQPAAMAMDAVAEEESKKPTKKKKNPPRQGVRRSLRGLLSRITSNDPKET